MKGVKKIKDDKVKLFVHSIFEYLNKCLLSDMRQVVSSLVKHNGNFEIGEGLTLSMYVIQKETFFKQPLTELIYIKDFIYSIDNDLELHDLKKVIFTDLDLENAYLNYIKVVRNDSNFFRIVKVLDRDAHFYAMSLKDADEDLYKMIRKYFIDVLPLVENNISIALQQTLRNFKTDLQL